MIGKTRGMGDKEEKLQSAALSLPNVVIKILFLNLQKLTLMFKVQIT